jgi:hypothetical protein
MTFDPEPQSVQRTKRKDLLWSADLCVCVCVYVSVCLCVCLCNMLACGTERGWWA